MIKVGTSIDHVRGFQVAGVHAGLKKDKALDFALFASNRNCVTAGVFTKNKVKAAPVLLNMERLKQAPETIRAVAINTVSANACTGQQGLEEAHKMSQLVANEIDCKAEQVLVMSTGVIGMMLPMDKIAKGAEIAGTALGDDWGSAAKAIMTTDTRPKLVSVSVLTPNGRYTIAGVSKGSGMIAPNMATMLSVVTTDATLTHKQAQTALTAATETSFNRIVVDGDTSTNDMVVLMANGASHVRVADGYDFTRFQQALNLVCKLLAQAIVRDGEGVTKFITLDIRNAESVSDAQKIGNTIAISPLVKTAFFGKDANWGRLLMAAGRADVPFDPDKTQLWISPGEQLFEDDRGLLIFKHGTPTDYTEENAAEIMQDSSIYVTLDCGIGDENAVIWTCDLSHAYVSINADYRS